MLVLLDLDGTLTDPYVGISRSVLFAFECLAVEPPPTTALRGFVGPPLQDSFRAWIPPADVDRAVAFYRERFAQCGWRENRVYDGIAPALRELQAAGSRMVVATSKPTVFAERIVDHFGLADFFDAVVGASLDGAVRHKADVITQALALTGSKAAAAVMVGDRAQDVLGAAAHGMRSIGVSWGYAEAGELETAGASTIIDAPGELPTAIPPAVSAV